MPVYNHIRYLKAAAESILAQTHRDLELLILDDGSEEDTNSVIDPLSQNDKRVRTWKQSVNQGYTKALNRLLQKATGDLIAFQNSDDISIQYRLERQIALLDSKHHMVSTWGKTINESGNIIRNYYTDTAQRRGIKDILAALKNGESWILGPTVMLSRQLINEIGPFDEECYFCQDYNYWIRCLKHTGLAVVPEVCYLYRHHPDSVRQRMRAFAHSRDWGAFARERAENLGSGKL